MNPRLFIIFSLISLKPHVNKLKASKIEISPKDCSKKSLIWKYDHKYSGGVLSSPASLVQSLMKDASKKMPYFKSY